MQGGNDLRLRCGLGEPLSKSGPKRSAVRICRFEAEITRHSPNISVRREMARFASGKIEGRDSFRGFFRKSIQISKAACHGRVGDRPEQEC